MDSELMTINSGSRLVAAAQLAINATLDTARREITAKLPDGYSVNVSLFGCLYSYQPMEPVAFRWGAVVHRVTGKVVADITDASTPEELVTRTLEAVESARANLARLNPREDRQPMRMAL